MKNAVFLFAADVALCHDNCCIRPFPFPCAGLRQHLALEGGADGLDFYRAILRNFDAALRPGGTICFEFGFGQETALTELLQAAGYEDVTLRKDLRGVVRAVSAKKPEA